MNKKAEPTSSELAQISLFDEKVNTLEDIKKSAEKAQVAIIESTGLPSLVRTQHFLRLLNTDPPAKILKQHPSVKVNGKPYMYVPIIYIEAILDKMFFGQWELVNFQFHQIMNEVAGSIELRVFHPITQQWITRSGAAAVQIQQTSGSKIADIVDTKVNNALEKNIPKLKAECFRNAAKTLGAVFGSGLTRGGKVEYSELIKENDVRESL